jgi:hypothetical protein
MVMIEDNRIAKRLRSLYREAGVARVEVIAACVRMEPEFRPADHYPSGHAPRPTYKQIKGRNAGIRNKMVEDGLRLNPLSSLNEGDRARMAGKMNHRTQRSAESAFKLSSDGAPADARVVTLPDLPAFSTIGGSTNKR